MLSSVTVLRLGSRGHVTAQFSKQIRRCSRSAGLFPNVADAAGQAYPPTRVLEMTIERAGGLNVTVARRALSLVALSQQETQFDWECLMRIVYTYEFPVLFHSAVPAASPEDYATYCNQLAVALVRDKPSDVSLLVASIQMMECLKRMGCDDKPAFKQAILFLASYVAYYPLVPMASFAGLLKLLEADDEDMGDLVRSVLAQLMASATLAEATHGVCWSPPGCMVNLTSHIAELCMQTGVAYEPFASLCMSMMHNTSRRSLPYWQSTMRYLLLQDRLIDSAIYNLVLSAQLGGEYLMTSMPKAIQWLWFLQRCSISVRPGIANVVDTLLLEVSPNDKSCVEYPLECRLLLQTYWKGPLPAHLAQWVKCQQLPPNQSVLHRVCNSMPLLVSGMECPLSAIHFAGLMHETTGMLLPWPRGGTSVANWTADVATRLPGIPIAVVVVNPVYAVSSIDELSVPLKPLKAYLDDRGWGLALVVKGRRLECDPVTAIWQAMEEARVDFLIKHKPLNSRSKRLT